MLGELKWLTFLLVAIILAMVIGVIVVRRRQNNRMREARIRGYKQALEEQKQYRALRQIEGRTLEDTEVGLDERYLEGRREIIRNNNNNKTKINK